MFRHKGAGELYLYVDTSNQLDSFWQPPLNSEIKKKHGTLYGTSVGAGSFNFTRGKWNRLQQSIQLNTFARNGTPNADGKMLVLWNGIPSITYDTMVWRDSPKVQFTGILWETFFGGSTDDYVG